MKLLSLSLLLALLAASAAAQPLSRSGASIHDHSTAAKGGTTLAPKLLSMPSASTANFAGAANFGPTVYTTTATPTAVITNVWEIVASTNPSGASEIYFYGLQSTRTYRVRFSLTVNTGAANLALTFNGDAGANYRWSNFTVTDAPASATTGSAADTKLLLLNTAADNVQGILGSFEFNSQPGTNNVRAIGNFQYQRTGAAAQAVDLFGGKYAGAAELSNLKIATTANTVTGYVYLEQLKAALP